MPFLYIPGWKKTNVIARNERETDPAASQPNAQGAALPTMGISLMEQPITTATDHPDAVVTVTAQEDEVDSLKLGRSRQRRTLVSNVAGRTIFKSSVPISKY